METMLSPEEQRALMAMNWADWPEEAATAATPPSKAAMRCCQIDQVGGGVTFSKTSTVGFPIRE